MATGVKTGRDAAAGHDPLPGHVKVGQAGQGSLYQRSERLGRHQPSPPSSLVIQGVAPSSVGRGDVGHFYLG